MSGIAQGYVEALRHRPNGTRFTMTQKWVFHLIASRYLDLQGTAMISLAELADVGAMSKRAVQNAIDELVADGLIVKVNRRDPATGLRWPNAYEIPAVPIIQQMAGQGVTWWKQLVASGAIPIAPDAILSASGAIPLWHQMPPLYKGLTEKHIPTDLSASALTPPEPKKGRKSVVPKVVLTPEQAATAAGIQAHIEGIHKRLPRYKRVRMLDDAASLAVDGHSLDDIIGCWDSIVAKKQPPGITQPIYQPLGWVADSIGNWIAAGRPAVEPERYGSKHGAARISRPNPKVQNNAAGRQAEAAEYAAKFANDDL